MPGLSLVGFLDRTAAFNHLRTAWDPKADDITCERVWMAAQNSIGATIPKAGKPEVLPVPPESQGHLQQLLSNPKTAPIFAQGGPLFGTEFRMVEIDPLFSYQLSILLPRAEHHCRHLGAPPVLQELLDMCLPLDWKDEECNVTRGPQTVAVTSADLNVRLVPNLAGQLQITVPPPVCAAPTCPAKSATPPQPQILPPVYGIMIGPTLPFAHVAHFNGNCYLHNGFHRAFGARMAGATHIPCVFRQATDYASVGVRQDGATFLPALFESTHPPTLAHFTQKRAHPLELRRFMRMVQVTWTELAVPAS